MAPLSCDLFFALASHPGRGRSSPWGVPWRIRLGPCFFRGSERGQGCSEPPLSTDHTGLSSDSGLGGSADGSSDILAFSTGSVVDSVTEEGGCAPPHLCPSPSPPPSSPTAGQAAAPDCPPPPHAQRVQSPRSPAARQTERRRPGAWRTCASCTLDSWHTVRPVPATSPHWRRRWPTGQRSTGRTQRMRARRRWCRPCSG